MAVSEPKRDVRQRSGRTVVFVFGPPRSGTSAVSHVLERLGVHFGCHDRFVDPRQNPHNPVFFELRSANELNDRICRRMGADYAEFSVLPDAQTYSDALYREFRDEIAALVDAELGGHPLVGLKDPRFVFTLPLWHRAMSELGHRCLGVITERDAGAMVKSNSLVNRDFSDSHNRRVVELSKLLAAWQSRLMPCALVDFDQAMNDPMWAVARLADLVGAADANLEDAACVLDPKLRNHPADAKLKATAPSSDLAELIEKRASHYSTFLDEMESLGLRTLVADLLKHRSQALRGLTMAEDRLRSARDLASDIAAGYASLIAMQPTLAPLRPPASFLYLPDEAGTFSERDVIGEHASIHGDSHSVEFQVNTASLRRPVRFDPDVVPGTYRLESVAINGRVVEDIERRVVASSEGGAFESRLVAASEGDDPWWIVSLADLEGLSGEETKVTVRFEFQRRTAMAIAADAAIERIRRHDEKLLGHLIREYEGRLDDLFHGHRTHLESLLAAAVGDVGGRFGGRLDAMAAVSRAQSESLQALREELSGRIDCEAAQQAAAASTIVQRLDELAGRQDRASEQQLAINESLQATREELSGRIDREAAQQAAAASTVVQRLDELAGRQDHAGEQQLASSQKLSEIEARLDALMEAQMQLLEYAKRRSSGYWLRRLFGKKDQTAGKSGQQ